jgi:hypothetical protein
MMFPVVGAGLGNGPGRMEVFGIEGYIGACGLAGYESRVVAGDWIVVRAADDLKPVVGSRLGMAGFSALHTAELTGPLSSHTSACTTNREGSAMSSSDMTRLTISWTKQTDLALRSYLGNRGMKKGDLSKFIEDAVRWRLLDQTVTAIKARNADADPEELTELIDATVRDIRGERAKKREGVDTKP